jgi:hypothetical protein
MPTEPEGFDPRQPVLAVPYQHHTLNARHVLEFFQTFNNCVVNNFPRNPPDTSRKAGSDRNGGWQPCQNTEES